jgi:hypothetical protein
MGQNKVIKNVTNNILSDDGLRDKIGKDELPLNACFGVQVGGKNLERKKIYNGRMNINAG